MRWPLIAGRLLREVARVFAQEPPVAVLGTGGYASAPVVWWAARHGIPTAIQEQNAYPGLATRWLSRRVRHVYLGLPEARRLLRFGPRTEVFDTGNPIAPPTPERRAEALDLFGLPRSGRVVLVTGGSQGALAINRAVAGWLDAGGPAGADLIWVTGRGTYDEFARYHRPPAVQVIDFLDPMADGYAVADLVVSRAGMITVAELCAWGLPSVLVPLPTAAADHQTHNARVLAEAGASDTVPQIEADTGPAVRNRAGAARRRAAAQRDGGPRAGAWPAPRRLRDSVAIIDTGTMRGGLSELAAITYISSSTMDLFNPADRRPVHFVGIGGAGMSALALIASRRGVVVSGCDSDPSGAADLAALGVPIAQGHDPSHVDGARAIVVTAAVPPSHPELERARALGVPVVPRKEALAALIGEARSVAVSGTHGKTTTTVMTTEALTAAGLAPTGIAGGRVSAWGGNARLAGDDLFVVEADEYDKAFLTLAPDGRDREQRGARPPRVLRLDGGARGCLRRVRGARGHRGGERGRPGRAAGGGASGAGRAAVRFVARGGRADRGGGPARRPDRGQGRLARRPDARPAAPGPRRAQPAQRGGARWPRSRRWAAISIGPRPRWRSSSGVGRRFERLGEHGGVAVVDDYAHHPSELAATLAAARQAYPGRRLVAVFQPHLYSRTAAHGQAMGEALAAADLVFVTEIYAAREQPMAGVSGRQVADAAGRAGADARFEPARRRGRAAGLRGAHARRRGPHARRRRHHPGRPRAGAVAGRRLRPGWKLIGALGVALALWFGLPRVLRGLDFFRVRRVEIAGLQYLDPAKVIAALRLSPTASVFDDPAPLARRVFALPGVASVEVSRRLPGTLAVAHPGTPAGGAGQPGQRPRRCWMRRGRVLPFDPLISAPDLPLAVERRRGRDGSARSGRGTPIPACSPESAAAWRVRARRGPRGGRAAALVRARRFPRRIFER